MIAEILMYPIDELAGIVAMADEKEQLALTEDIRKNGQQEPAVLWQGRIVDGRCRQLACVTLGIKLKIRSLDDSLTREEVAKVVKSLNTRRNLTDMQKAMSAFKEQEKRWETNAKIAENWGLALGTYKNARYIGLNRPDLVEDLFNGKTVKIYDPDKGFDITTDKINTLARIIKKTAEIGVVEDTSEKVEIQWSADGLIKTEAGKEWYYGRIKKYDIPNDAVGLRTDLIELANLKFKNT